jgi:hypothetical protein
LLFAILIIVETAIFYTQVAIDVTPFYPSNHDQVNYLIDAYSLVSTMRESGIGAGMAKSLTWPGAIGIFVTSRGSNGFLFPIQGALASVLVGIDRAGVLTVNLLVFVLLQIVVFRLVKWKTRRENDAWLAVALVLMLSSPFFFAGGIFDFRIDFFALCAMGIWAGAVLRSGVFPSLRWSVIAGVAGGWLTCTRYISFVYLVPVLGVLLVAFGITWARATSRFRRATAWVRCWNIFISCLITTSCVAPLLLINREIIYKYYFVSMFVNAEKEIRANELGLHTLSDHLSLYPKSIVFDHLGKPALVAIGVLLLWCCLAARVWERPGRAALWQGIRSESKALWFLAATILVPLVFLNLSLSKSPVIGGILSIPVLLVVMVLMCASRNDGVSGRTVPQPSRSWWPIQVSSSWFPGGFVVAAMIVFAYMQGDRSPVYQMSNGQRSTRFMTK